MLSGVTKEKPVFYIDGSVTEFVISWPQLGRIIINTIDDSLDVKNRRNFGQINYIFVILRVY